MQPRPSWTSERPMNHRVHGQQAPSLSSLSGDVSVLATNTSARGKPVQQTSTRNKTIPTRRGLGVALNTPIMAACTQTENQAFPRFHATQQLVCLVTRSLNTQSTGYLLGEHPSIGYLSDNLTRTQSRSHISGRNTIHQITGKPRI